MQFMLITAIPEIASFIEDCGVERIFVDMEVRGKAVRQHGMDTPIHQHSFSDVSKLKKILKKAELLLRINPLHKDTKEEIEKGIDHGADIIMLPFFHHQKEVESFLKIVDGRVKTNILFESDGAVGRAEQIFSIKEIDEVHFGLNDLKISLGLDFLFETVSGGLIEWLCDLARKNNLSYGIGGIGRVGKETLPAENIMKEYVRLGSERVILSRVFHGNTQSLKELKEYTDFFSEVKKLLEAEKLAKSRNESEIKQDKIKFAQEVSAIASTIANKKMG